jgi:hypothetical protein
MIHSSTDGAPRRIYSWLMVPIRLRRAHRSDPLARVNILLGHSLRQLALAGSGRDEPPRDSPSLEAAGPSH